MGLGLSIDPDDVYVATLLLPPFMMNFMEMISSTCAHSRTLPPGQVLAMDPLSLRLAALTLVSTPLEVLNRVPDPPTTSITAPALLQDLVLIIQFCRDTWHDDLGPHLPLRGTIILMHRLLRASRHNLRLAWLQEAEEPSSTWTLAVRILLRYASIGPFMGLPLPVTERPPGTIDFPQAERMILDAQRICATHPEALRAAMRPESPDRATTRVGRTLAFAACTSHNLDAPAGDVAEHQRHDIYMTAIRLAMCTLRTAWMATTWHSTLETDIPAQTWGPTHTMLLWLLAHAPEPER